MPPEIEEQKEEEQKEEAEQSQEENSQEEQNSEENSEESEEQGEGSQNDSSASDDTPVEIEVDGKKETVTLGELRKGYMRQSDYTRKTQELAEKVKDSSQEDQKAVAEKSQEIVDNPENFSSEDVETAKYLLKVIKGTGIAKEFGLMTKEEYEAEKTKEKQVAEFGSKIETTKSKIDEMKGMPSFNEDEILDHMGKTGIHDPMAAYLNKYDAQYRDYILKQAQGNKSYKSDKGGKKPEPNKKEVDVRTEEGHRSFLADEIKNLQN